MEAGVPLARMTTYRLGGPAAVFVEPAGERDLASLGRVLKDEVAGPVPVLPVGRGSNLVVSDEGYEGVVVRLGASFSGVKESSGADTLVAGASTALPVLANKALRRKLEGLEFAVSIPGSLGGAVRMNAGAHGTEIGDRLVSARLFSFESLALEERHAPSFGFGYRASNVAPTEVVLEACLALTPADPTVIKGRMESFRKHRAETQPGALQNAGSVFKNPPGDAAGRLIEAAGLKGFEVGGVAVSDLHANFFVAGDRATAQDVFDLVAAVRRRVLDASGVALEPEIRFVGSFREHVSEVGS